MEVLDALPPAVAAVAVAATTLVVGARVEEAADWGTVAALARRLGRPESTVRHWRNIYRPWVPERRDAHDRAIYPLAVFERIQLLQGRGLTPREVRRELGTPSGGGLAQPPSRAQADDVAETLREIRDALRQQTAVLGAELRAIRALLERERDA